MSDKLHANAVSNVISAGRSRPRAFDYAKAVVATLRTIHEIKAIAVLLNISSTVTQGSSVFGEGVKTFYGYSNRVVDLQKLPYDTSLEDFSTFHNLYVDLFEEEPTGGSVLRLVGQGGCACVNRRPICIKRTPGIASEVDK
ncbi:FAD binding domain-containing protein [Apiospora marii]|uniref:FAD binding domain-containing protein n=1 Tax=Apiospora marii TaxID=335849 RepID=A0ABR1RBK6_9PEZI